MMNQNCHEGPALGYTHMVLSEDKMTTCTKLFQPAYAINRDRLPRSDDLSQ